MSTATSNPRTEPARDARPTRSASALYSSLVGLSAVAIVLQGLWAGMFIREGKGYDDSWVSIHAHGADVSILLAALATAAALWKLRSARELWIGSGVLTVGLIVNAYLGGQISDGGHQGLTAVHVPLAMALMGLSAWLPFRAARSSRDIGAARAAA